MPLPEEFEWDVSPGADPPAPPAAPAVPEPGDCIMESVDVMAHDVLEVLFNMDMAMNDALSLKTNYTVNNAPGNGVPVIVKDVLVPRTGTTTRRVELVISDFTVGEEYQVTAHNVTTKEGNEISEFNSASFIGRTTKIDSILNSMPAIYDLSPGSDLRGLFMAIGRSDDLSSGSRSDGGSGAGGGGGEREIGAEEEEEEVLIELVGFKLTDVNADADDPSPSPFVVDRIDEDVEVGDLIIVLSANPTAAEMQAFLNPDWEYFDLSANSTFTDNVIAVYRYADAGDVSATEYEFERSVGLGDTFTSIFAMLVFRGVNQTTPWGDGEVAGAVIDGMDPAVCPGTPALSGPGGALVVRAWLSLTGLYTPEDATLIVRDSHEDSFITIATEEVGEEDPLTEETGTLFSGANGTFIFPISIPLAPA